MLFKYISYPELCWPFYHRAICAILVEGIMRINSVITLNLDQLFRRSVVYKISYLELLWPSSAELNHLCNFGRGHYGKLF